MADPELKKELIPNVDDDKKMTNYEIFKTCLYLGVTSFGGPIAHIGMFEKIFIKENKLISPTTFSQLFALANVVPGPTSSQLLTAIAIVKTKSLQGGIISFLCFNMPALIVMISFAEFIKTNYLTADLDQNSLNILQTIAIGICQGAVAVVLQAGMSLSSKIKNSNFQLSITIVSAIIYLSFNQYYMMIILMTLSGFFSTKLHEEKFLIPNPQKIFELRSVKFIGIPALATFFVIYVLVYVFYFIFNDYSINFYLIESFYRIGALIIGGGHVVIPMVLNEFEKILSKKDILNAFTLVSLLPGPMFNIAGYIGAIVNGIFSGFLSAFFIFLPGMLLLFSSLRFMTWVNEKPKLQFFLRGVSSSAIGFIFTSATILWYDSCVKNIHFHFLLGTMNFFISFLLLEKYKMNVLFVLFIAAVYGFVISMYNTFIS